MKNPEKHPEEQAVDQPPAEIAGADFADDAASENSAVMGKPKLAGSFQIP
jgi:hypothetical protein